MVLGEDFQSFINIHVFSDSGQSDVSEGEEISFIHCKKQAKLQKKQAVSYKLWYKLYLESTNQDSDPFIHAVIIITII